MSDYMRIVTTCGRPLTVTPQFLPTLSAIVMDAIRTGRISAANEDYPEFLIFASEAMAQATRVGGRPELAP